tara:strand:+ start:339 stop:674 length:336 start_codon:yes stop_codon:yes gene_type:complete
MTVKERTGPKFREGFTFHVSVPYTRVRENVPCYELKWDDEGQVKHTGRYALITWSDAENTQQVSSDHMIPDLDIDDPRLCSKEEYQTRMAAINKGDWLGGLPERMDSEAPF